MVSSRLVLSALLLIGAATLLQGSRVYGHVTDTNGTPLAHAYVWIADTEDVQLRLRTDSYGRFHAWHRPFSLRRGAMLICAPGHSTMVREEISRAWVSEFGIGPWPESAVHPPRPAESWVFASPAECAERTARGSS